MALYNNRYRVESARLQGWDYASAAWYYVTTCTKERASWFGVVVDGEVCLSKVGEVARQYWEEIPIHFANVSLDVFVIMPNHVHGIVIVEGQDASLNHGDDRRDVAVQRLYQVTDTDRDQTLHPTADGADAGINSMMSKISPKAGSLSVIIRSYKATVTKWCRVNGYESFAWQAGMFEHIVRNDTDLRRIREYIDLNSAKWDLDEYNPDNPDGIDRHGR
jgi:putative transposase